MGEMRECCRGELSHFYMCVLKSGHSEPSHSREDEEIGRLERPNVCRGEEEQPSI